MHDRKQQQRHRAYNDPGHAQRRKHLAIDTLTKALARIGCTLRIMPLDTTPSRD